MIGIIGGSGLGAALSASQAGERIDVDTPFGRPSAPLVKAKWEGTDVVFLNRHGDGHVYNPSKVPYRANIFALKKLGVTTVIASGATGSLREDIHPGELVVCDQVIDRTFARAKTFFDEGLVAHVEFADPFCPALREVILSVSNRAATTVHPRGTYVCMEGPQFSTRAESHMHRAWGGDLIGMTCMPEARLAREAEICYAVVAIPTDYDCWRPHEPGESPDHVLESILANLEAGTAHAIALMKAAAPRIAGTVGPDCGCRSALAKAVWTDRKAILPAAVKRLKPLVGKYLR